MAKMLITKINRRLADFRVDPDTEDDGAQGADPEEGGGGGGEGAEPFITVGGKGYSREEAERRLANHDRLQDEYTPLKGSLAKLERDNAVLSGRVEELSKRGVPDGQKPPEKPAAPDFDAEYQALDPYDKDYQAKLTDVRRREREAVQQDMRRQLQDTTTQIRAEVNRTLTVDKQKGQVDQFNREMFTDHLGDEKVCPIKLSKVEREAVWKAMNSLVDNEYGDWYPDLEKIRYKPNAVETALWAVPSVRKRILAARDSETFGDGLGARERGLEAEGSRPGSKPAAKPPGKGSSNTQVLAWLKTQPLEVRETYVHQHPDFRKWFITNWGKAYAREKRTGNAAAG